MEEKTQHVKLFQVKLYHTENYWTVLDNLMALCACAFIGPHFQLLSDKESIASSWVVVIEDIPAERKYCSSLKTINNGFSKCTRKYA